MIHREDEETILDAAAVDVGLANSTARGLGWSRRVGTRWSRWRRMSG
ncbi:hypothetical protein [Nonomuraea sp. NPDC049129]